MAATATGFGTAFKPLFSGMNSQLGYKILPSDCSDPLRYVDTLLSNPWTRHFRRSLGDVTDPSLTSTYNLDMWTRKMDCIYRNSDDLLRDRIREIYSPDKREFVDFGSDDVAKEMPKKVTKWFMDEMKMHTMRHCAIAVVMLAAAVGTTMMIVKRKKSTNEKIEKAKKALAEAKEIIEDEIVEFLKEKALEDTQWTPRDSKGFKRLLKCADQSIQHALDYLKDAESDAKEARAIGVGAGLVGAVALLALGPVTAVSALSTTGPSLLAAADLVSTVCALEMALFGSFSAADVQFRILPEINRLRKQALEYQVKVENHRDFLRKKDNAIESLTRSMRS